MEFTKVLILQKGDVLCWFHADLRFDPIDAIESLRKIRDFI